MRFALCLLSVLILVAGDCFAQSAQQLVPAQFNRRTDSSGAAVGCPEHWLHQCRDKQHIQQLVSADRQSEQLQPELADDDGRRVRVCADADFADERCAGHQANQGRPEEALLPFCRSPQESRFEHDQRDGPGADSNGARSVSKHAQRSRHRNRLGSGQG